VSRVPALIVAGYLGSGKTTLVRHLLAQAQRDGVRLAIVSNEFGDTGIDKALLDAGQDGFVELDGGCVCCRLSDALPMTLQTLIDRVRPDRLVLECSGVALPGELVIQFWRPPLSDLVSDEVVAVVVDAERAAGGEIDETFVEQLEAADVVVLNKRDRVDPDGLAAALARVAEISRGRPTIVAEFGQVDASALFPPDPEGARERRRDPAAEPHAHDHERFVTRELQFAPGIDERALVAELIALDAIRCKGFVATDQGLRLVQGVAGRIELSPPPLPPPADLVGTVVVITRDPS
jgi:G3E family GTPase